MLFKDEDRLKEEFWKVDPQLRRILCDIEVLAYPDIPVITSIYRTEEENKAAGAKTIIHCVFRAADIRPFEDEDTNAMIINLINGVYIYDRKRPKLKTIYRHIGTGDHLHIQCRPIEDISFENRFPLE